MKHACITCGLLTVFLCLSGCSGALSPEQEGALTLVISDGEATKASDVTELAYERRINNLQVFLFEGGVLQNYERMDTRDQTFPLTKHYPGVRAGMYQVYVVANAALLEGVTTEAGLMETAVHLSDCSLDETQGFVMSGSGSVAVGESEARVQVSLQRFATRIRLASVKNRVPAGYAEEGSITVKGVFLINALGSWMLSGSGSASEWVNLGGRLEGRTASTERNDFLLSEGQVHPAGYRSQVFRSLSSSVARGASKSFSDCCLYSFPNPVITDHTGNSATESSGAMTRLVVLARVNGEDWWYPVTLFKDGEGPGRNTSCDVKLTLRATGSSDPNEPVGAGSLEAVVSVRGWYTGVKYTETL